MLARQTVERLRVMRAANPDGEWVFPNRSASGPPVSESGVQKAFRLCDRAGLPEGFVTHSLRHAALTWIAEQGGGRDIRNRFSNHAPPRNDADHIYVAAQLNAPATDWTQRWVDHLSALEAANVIEIGAVRA